MRENCGKQFDAHWECLERKNHVCHCPKSQLPDYPFSRHTRLVGYTTIAQNVSPTSANTVTLP